MLLAVQGGGFFSSSASGYSKGLALLLLGQTSDENHMRVAPWNQYQLVDQHTDTGTDTDTDNNLQLASSGKNRLSRGCASFVCFGRASAGLDGQLPLKVGPAQPQDSKLPNGPETEGEKELTSTVLHRDSNSRGISLKSSLKKPSHNAQQTDEKSSEQEPLTGEGTEEKCKKVQWTDTYGKELAEIREFELSETGGSDDEFISSGGKTCSCSIM